MPNYIKKLGMQSEPTGAVTLYDINSDIATFKSLGKTTTTLTLDENYKYTIIEWNERDSNGLTITIPTMTANQELYAILINKYDRDIEINLKSPSTNATYYTGEVEKGSNGTGSFNLQKETTMEVSIIRLDNVSGSTVSSYYFVRVA